LDPSPIAELYDLAAGANRAAGGRFEIERALRRHAHPECIQRYARRKVFLVIFFKIELFASRHDRKHLTAAICCAVAAAM